MLELGAGHFSILRLCPNGPRGFYMSLLLLFLNGVLRPNIRWRLTFDTYPAWADNMRSSLTSWGDNFSADSICAERYRRCRMAFTFSCLYLGRSLLERQPISREFPCEYSWCILHSPSPKNFPQRFFSFFWDHARKIIHTQQHQKNCLLWWLVDSTAKHSTIQIQKLPGFCL